MSAYCAASRPHVKVVRDASGNRLNSCSVGFRSDREPYLDSCGIFKDTVVPILGTIAKQERLRI